MAKPAYQDWARYQVPSADSVDSGNPTNPVDFTGPTVDCSPWKYIIITLFNNDNVATLACGITWTGYNGTFVAQHPDLFTVAPNQEVNLLLPVRGRTLSVFYHVQSGTTTLGAQYDITGLSCEPTKYEASKVRNVLVHDFSAYAANQAKSFFPDFWYEGKVLISASGDAGGLANLIVNYFDTQFNAYTPYAAMGVVSVSTAMPRVIAFPPHPVRVDVGNGVTAQNIRVVMMPFPD